MGTVEQDSTIIESALYGINRAHNTAGLSDPCEADIVRSIVEASKRELNRPIKKERTAYGRFNEITVSKI
jgi:hypothetical protein